MVSHSQLGIAAPGQCFQEIESLLPPGEHFHGAENCRGTCLIVQNHEHSSSYPKHIHPPLRSTPLRFTVQPTSFISFRILYANPRSQSVLFALELLQRRTRKNRGIEGGKSRYLESQGVELRSTLKYTTTTPWRAHWGAHCFRQSTVRETSSFSNVNTSLNGF